MRQKGSALTEMVVLTLVMVPLMFAIPMLGNMIDVRQTSVQASRYAAWEATVHAPGSARPDQMKSRFFGESDSTIASAPSDGGSNVLWGGAGDVRRNRPDADSLPAQTRIAIDSNTVAAIDYDRDHGEESLRVAGAVGGAIDAAGSVLEAVTGRDLGIGETRLTRTGVKVAIKSNGWLSSMQEACAPGAFACLEEVSYILTDGWSASGHSQARERARALVPATGLERIGETLSLIGVLPIFEELEGTEDMFGHVDTTQLPEVSEQFLELRSYEEED